MTGRTHAAYGLAIGVVVASSQTSSLESISITNIIAVMTSWLGSLMPDIDSEGSRMGRKVPLISKGMNRLFGHRGFLHTPLCLMMIFLTGYFLIYELGRPEYLIILICFCLGYLSHLMLDFATKGGIRLLYPVSKKYYHLTKLKTGSLIEAYALIVLGGGLTLYAMTLPSVRELIGISIGG